MAIQSLLVLLAAPLVASYSLPAVSTATRSSRAVSASAPLSSIRMQEAEAEAPPAVTAPDAYIEFIIGYPEPVVPDVSLTRSRQRARGQHPAPIHQDSRAPRSSPLVRRIPSPDIH